MSYCLMRSGLFENRRTDGKSGCAGDLSISELHMLVAAKDETQGRSISALAAD